MRKIHLRLDLGAIAPVDEHAGHVRQHNAKPRRAGEPRQPLQPLIARSHVFALMHIAARHDKPRQPHAGNGHPKGRQSRRALGGGGLGVKGLEHYGLLVGLG